MCLQLLRAFAMGIQAEAPATSSGEAACPPACPLRSLAAGRARSARQGQRCRGRSRWAGAAGALSRVPSPPHSLPHILPPALRWGYSMQILGCDFSKLKITQSFSKRSSSSSEAGGWGACELAARQLQHTFFPPKQRLWRGSSPAQHTQIQTARPIQHPNCRGFTEQPNALRFRAAPTLPQVLPCPDEKGHKPHSPEQDTRRMKERERGESVQKVQITQNQGVNSSQVAPRQAGLSIAPVASPRRLTAVLQATFWS